MTQNEVRTDLQEECVRRLAKVARHRRRWASRIPTEAWRAYDHDLPSWPMLVDVYGDSAHVQVDDAMRADALDSVQRVVAAGLGFGLEDVWVKVRRRQRRRADGAAEPSEVGFQYQRAGGANVVRTVEEGGAAFRINLSEYFDAGLFVDHRPARLWVRGIASGLRVLNLFCYTGAFSVHAALGGAASTVSVDTSARYLGWAADNFAANGIGCAVRTEARQQWAHHQLVRDDVPSFLHYESLRGVKFDLIIVDPPTHSVARRAQRRFDVRHDHPALLSSAARLLDPGGALFFSTNSARFRFQMEEDPWLVSGGWVSRETTPHTVPKDCERITPHRSWLVWNAAATPPFPAIARAW